MADENQSEAAIELAHEEIWRRFVDEYGVVLDYTALDGTNDQTGPWFYGLWRPQRNRQDVEEVSGAQSNLENRNSPRRQDEMKFVRDPAFAAWIVTLCPDPAPVARHRAALLETMTYYRYSGLRFSQFFPLESAWWRLQSI